MYNKVKFHQKFIWFVCFILALFFFKVIRFRRNIITSNIKKVFSQWSLKQVNELSILFLQHQFFNLFELLSLRYWQEDDVKQKVVFDGLENFENAFLKNKGVLILGLHMGHGDLSANMLAYLGKPFNLITKVFKNKKFNSFWFKIRNRFGVKYIDAHNKKNAFQILSALKSNECVGFVIDQYMGKPFGIETDFFGIKTGTAYGLALFKLKTDSPVIPVYAYRDKDYISHIVFDPEINLELNINMDQDEKLKALTNGYNKVLEKIILKHPEQWMWLHRRWKNFNS